MLAVAAVFSLYRSRYGEGTHEDDTRLCASVYVHRIGISRASLTMAIPMNVSSRYSGGLFVIIYDEKDASGR